MADPPPEDAPTLAGRLYDTHGAALYRYALMLLGGPGEAEDAVHQVFIAILRQRPRIEDDAHYLRRAVRNECYSTLRRRRVRETGEPLLEPIAEGRPPEERLGLESAIRALPPEQREVVHLRAFEGLTFQEIADASDTSINTIAARYRYALAKMREMLTDERR